MHKKRGCRTYETASSLSKRTVIPTAKQEESREIKRKTRKRTDLYIAQYQLFKMYAMGNFNASALDRTSHISMKSCIFAQNNLKI